MPRGRTIALWTFTNKDEIDGDGGEVSLLAESAGSCARRDSCGSCNCL